MDQFDDLFYEAWGQFNGQSDMLAFLSSFGVSDETLNSMYKQLVTTHIDVVHANLKASQENADIVDKVQNQVTTEKQQSDTISL